MRFHLPIFGQDAEIRDFIPHKVVVAYNEAMYRGVQIKSTAVTATKEELLKEFGPETIAALDAMPPAEYEAKFSELRQEYLRRSMDLQGMTMGNVEEANMRKVVGMVLTIAGKQVTRETIEELPHEDFELILEKVQEVADASSKKKASAPSAS